MIELKSPAEIERMRVAGAFVAEILTKVGARADVGVNLLDLERHARDLIRERGAESCYWDYAPSFGNGPFRNVICLSVNDAVLHGLPHDYALRDGDLLSMDLAVGIDGWVADAARSMIVGTPADEDLRLVRATEAALEAGIKAAQPGTAWATSRRRSGQLRTTTATRSTRSSVVTGWGGPCTKTPMSPTTAARAVASSSCRA